MLYCRVGQMLAILIVMTDSLNAIMAVSRPMPDAHPVIKMVLPYSFFSSEGFKLYVVMFVLNESVRTVLSSRDFQVQLSASESDPWP